MMHGDGVGEVNIEVRMCRGASIGYYGTQSIPTARSRGRLSAAAAAATWGGERSGEAGPLWAWAGAATRCLSGYWPPYPLAPGPLAPASRAIH